VIVTAGGRAWKESKNAILFKGHREEIRELKRRMVRGKGSADERKETSSAREKRVGP